MARIAVIGLGHTGLVVAAVFADLGHQVIGHDIESEKRNAIQQGESPFYEPGLNELIGRGLESGRLRVVDTIDECLDKVEIVFLAVGTPNADGDGPDLSEFWSAVGQVIPLMPRQAVLAIKSTLPIGTTDKLISRFSSFWPDESRVVVVPEFLRQGSAVEDFRRPDRIVLGSDSSRALAIVRGVYKAFQVPEDHFIECTPTGAELIKHATNAFLATKISFANQLANLCGRLGVDYETIRRALAADPRVGGRFLHAGLGFGGSCFPKDVAALIGTARQADLPFSVLEAAFAANRAQIERVAELARDMLGDFKGKKILQLGLTYKPGTDDLRGSLALELAFLLARSGADVVAYDPAHPPGKAVTDHVFKLAGDPLDAAAGADLIIIATEWPQYGELPWPNIAKSMRTPNLLDGRNMLDPEAITAAGFTYRGIGRH